MSLRTPLNKVRGLGAARSGTKHFWHQRLTALANIPLALIGLVIIVSLAGASHAEVVARLSSPFVTLVLAAFLISVLWHMKLGMQVVIEDYIHSRSVQLTALIANLFFTAGAGLTGLYALLKLNFGV